MPEIDMILRCAECGKDLGGASILPGIIHVDPCSRCLEVVKNYGFETGETDDPKPISTSPDSLSFMADDVV